MLLPEEAEDLLGGHKRFCMDVINELVNDTERLAEDKVAYTTLKSDGINPFGTKNIADTFKASEVTFLILEELSHLVDGCDSSLANLIFSQTSEGLAALQKKVKSREAFEKFEGSFTRSNTVPEMVEHEITQEEFYAMSTYLVDYKISLEEKFRQFNNTKYAQLKAFRDMKAQESLHNKGNGNKNSFWRE